MSWKHRQEGLLCQDQEDVGDQEGRAAEALEGMGGPRRPGGMGGPPCGRRPGPPPPPPGTRLGRRLSTGLLSAGLPYVCTGGRRNDRFACHGHCRIDLIVPEYRKNLPAAGFSVFLCSRKRVPCYIKFSLVCITDIKADYVQRMLHHRRQITVKYNGSVGRAVRTFMFCCIILRFSELRHTCPYPSSPQV